jgi:hypothetical protein
MVIRLKAYFLYKFANVFYITIKEIKIAIRPLCLCSEALKGHLY